MSRKILIDSSLENETRIALINNDKLEEYEIEKSNDNRIKSNIYLAKISRVEASLQAAFVEFGGNKNGFLPFTEIHPDYFKLPVADQKKLKGIISENSQDSDNENKKNNNNNLNIDDEEKENNTNQNKLKEQKISRKKIFNNFFRKYRIQDVIKPRQIILVQISKEERGLKGASLTTYLSFAGRYCVLMPNSDNTIGISRKIHDIEERRKLKEALDSIGIPNGMAVIIRTAGIGKTKKDISKDLDYLINQWNKIRDLTLKSDAPSLIYEEGNIIKRTIRDLYTKEISEILIDGKNGYNIAKKYGKAIIPKNSNKIKLYKEKKENIFAKYNLEKQIEELYNVTIKLISGGSIVINSTEALVAIDVNSGKATHHRNIETTALNTNLEAAQEIARQLKLRDLAGLIVVDFIDMEEHRNNFKVEKALKTATNLDRARIQIGRISPFGLLELSRQRLRTSIMEHSYEKCELCNGTGIVRNVNSITEQLFKTLLQYCISNSHSTINIKCNSKLSTNILNNKKNTIINLENDYKCKLIFEFNNAYPLNETIIKITSKITSKNVIVQKSSNVKKILTNKKTKPEKTKRKLKKIINKKKAISKKIKNSQDVKENKEFVENNPKNINLDDSEKNNEKEGWWSQ